MSDNDDQYERNRELLRRTLDRLTENFESVLILVSYRDNLETVPMVADRGNMFANTDMARRYAEGEYNRLRSNSGEEDAIT